MSLLKLLTTGKSLVGLKDTESRYRMTSQNLLPKFGSGKNPFRDASAAEAASVGTKPAVREEMPVPASRGLEATPVRAANPGERASLLHLGTAKCRDLAARPGRWLSQLGSLLWRPARKPARSAAVPVLAKPQAKQGELSLDRIKVVRNDLSDADLEIIASKPKAARMAKAIPAAKDETGPSAGAWENAPERVLSTADR